MKRQQPKISFYLKNAKQKKETTEKKEEEPVYLKVDIPIPKPTSELWVNKYAPKELNDFVGHKPLIEKIKDWIIHFSYTTYKQRYIVIHGPPGVGKTTIVSLLCKQLNIPLHAFNASDDRNTDFIENIKPLIQARRKCVILMDEFDGLMTKAITLFLKYATKSANPIICICNDWFGDESLATMRSKTTKETVFEFKRLSTDEIKSYLRQICNKENKLISEPQLTKIVLTSAGDLRNAINQLSFITLKPTEITLKTRNEDINFLGITQFNQLTIFERYEKAMTMIKKETLYYRLLYLDNESRTFTNLFFNNYLKEPKLDNQKMSELADLFSLYSLFDICPEYIPWKGSNILNGVKNKYNTLYIKRKKAVINDWDSFEKKIEDSKQKQQDAVGV